MYVIVSSWTDCSICFSSVLIDFRFAISTNLSIYVTLIGILWELELVKECHYHDILTWWNDSSICSRTCSFVVLTLGFLLLIFVFESSSSCSNDHGYIPLVVIAILSFPHSGTAYPSGAPMIDMVLSEVIVLIRASRDGPYYVIGYGGRRAVGGARASKQVSAQ